MRKNQDQIRLIKATVWVKIIAEKLQLLTGHLSYVHFDLNDLLSQMNKTSVDNIKRLTNLRLKLQAKLFVIFLDYPNIIKWAEMVDPLFKRLVNPTSIYYPPKGAKSENISESDVRLVSIFTQYDKKLSCVNNEDAFRMDLTDIHDDINAIAETVADPYHRGYKMCKLQVIRDIKALNVSIVNLSNVCREIKGDNYND